MKLIKLSLLTLLFVSCSKDEVPTTEPVTVDCNCGTIQNANYFQIPSGNFTQFEVRNNCTGEVENESKEGRYRNGETYCW